MLKIGDRIKFIEDGSSNLYIEDADKGIYYIATQLTERNVLTNQFGDKWYILQGDEPYINNDPNLRDFLSRYRITYDGTKGYSKIGINGTSKLLHRVVYEYYHKTIPSGYVIDHFNGDNKNNKKRNLVAMSSDKHDNDKVKDIHSIQFPYGIDLEAENGYYYMVLVDMSSYENNKFVHLRYNDIDSILKDLKDFVNSSTKTIEILKIIDRQAYDRILVEHREEKAYNNDLFIINYLKCAMNEDTKVNCKIKTEQLDL